MHNGRMNRVLARSLAVVLSGALLAGCSGTGDKKGDPDSSTSPSTSTSGSPSPTPSETPYLPVPDGVELTKQGSMLAVGDSAVVAYQPRQNVVGVLDLRVTRLEKTSFKESFAGWKLDAATEKSTPYFVHVRVKNVGDSDLGGRRVPLYIVDGTNTLIESSSFASTFKPCPSTPFPKKFGPGAKADFCLVYLSPNKGELTAVSFRPTEDFKPILWTGEVEAVAKGRPKKHQDKQG
jgi:hypothetical protein